MNDQNPTLAASDTPVRVAPPAVRPDPRSAGEFLLAHGRRVRETRDRRGLTRKQLARDAGVSERHLAHLEAGEGNVSVVNAP